MSSALGRVIFLIFSCVSWLYLFLPRRVQLCFGKCFGFLLFLTRVRAPVILQNLCIAFPKNKKKQNSLFHASYQHLGNLILEILMLLGPMRQFILKYVDVEGIEYVKGAQQKGKGILFLSSHLGNWEIMAAMGGVTLGLDVLIVTKRLKPLLLHRMIEKGRLKCGVKGVYEPRTLKTVLEHLKRNQAVGFILDQYSGSPVGVRVPFFTLPVGTSSAFASLVKRTQSPVLPVENFRKEDGRWCVRIHPPVLYHSFQNKNYEIAFNTAQFVSILEGHIKLHPEQWLWLHRRFKGDLSPLKKNEWAEPRQRGKKIQ